jgi:hypothetical protein
MHALRPALLAAVAAAAFLPAGALAAPDRDGVLDADHLTFSWDSKLGTGLTTLSNLHDQIPCGTPVVHDCDFTLIKVTGAGTVGITNESSDPNAVDTDLYVYDSDADGTQGDQLASSAQSSPTPNEATSVDTAEGDSWLLVEIDYTDNVAGTVKATATFTPAPPEETPEGASF